MPQAYEHRLRELICEPKDIELAVRLGVPASTARSWLRRGRRQVVLSSVFDGDARQLKALVLQLEQRIAWLMAIMRLLVVLVRLGGGRLDEQRVPQGQDKARILAVVGKAIEVLPLRQTLHVIGLTRERYWSWRRKEPTCELNDQVSCPRSKPTRLTHRSENFQISVIRF